MAFTPAPNIVQVELRCTFAAQKVENRFNIDALEPVTPEIVATITNLVSVWAQGNYFAHLPSAVALREVVGTDLTTADGSQHTITPEGEVVGGLNSDPMPNEVTFCIKLTSGNRGRSARGRSYVLGLIKGDCSGNFLGVGRANELASDFNDLITVMDGEGFSLVVVSYITNNAPRVGGPVYYPITGAGYTDLTLDSMRRRRPGNGS
jgi:hypothetical protein